MKPVYMIFSLCTLCVLMFSFYASGPPVGVTGAPGELTCSTTPGCHFGGTFTGTIDITGLPATVVANTVYTITFTVNSATAVKGGFELTCLDKLNAACGTLTAGTGQSVDATTPRQYVAHTSPKAYASGSIAWTFTWKAPATLASGPITFYGASNLTNGNGGMSGDNAITIAKQVAFSTISPTADLVTEDRITLSPNPTSQIMTVQFQQNNVTARLSLIDLSGKNVLQQNVSNNTNINVADLARGIYFARFIFGDNTVVKKIELN